MRGAAIFRSAMILAAAVICAGIAAAAEPDQRIVALDSGVYDLLAGLYQEQGLAPPSSAVPYSYEELRRALRRLDGSALSAAGRRTRASIEALLAKQPGYSEEEGFRFYPSFRVNAELYLHTNRDYNEWVYDAKDRNPFFGFYFDIVMSDRFVLYGDLTVQKDPFQTGGDPDNYTSILTSPNQFDLNMPYRGALSFGGAHWNLLLGRDRMSWGNGRTGNLMLSDADVYHEGLRFTSFWERFKFSFVLLGLESWTEEASFGDDYTYPAAVDTAVLERFKMFIAHRLEFLFRPNLRFSMSETIVFGGKYPDLRVFNPFLLYHNLYLKEWTNNLMTLELDYAPMKGFLVYGQFAMDQFSTVFEKDTYGTDSEPNAMGFLAGVEYRRSVGQGHLTAAFEFVRTDPWLYIREHPLVSFFSTRRIHSEARKDVLGDKNYYFINTPIGYGYGPDVVVNSLLVSYTVPEGWSVYGEYRLILAGENDINTVFSTGDAAWDLNTPSGNADVKNIVTIGGWRRISPRISVFGEASIVYNEGDSDLQAASGLRITF